MKLIDPNLIDWVGALRIGDPRRVCQCCMPAIGRRVQISQKLVDQVRRQEGMVVSDEPWRGPHQYIEHILMMHHGKTVALISTEEQLMLAPHHVWFHWSEDLQSWVVWTLEGARRARMLLRAKSMRRRSLISLNNYHRRMGICLGYTSEQIRRFVQE